MEKIMRKKMLIDYALIGAATALLAAGVHFFFIPHDLVVGGLSGLGIIVAHYTADWAFPIPVWLTQLVISIPLILVAWKMLGVKYIAKAIYATVIITLTLFLLDMLPYNFAIETDLLLASVFGGVLCGVAVAIVIRREATTGGTILLADLISRVIKRFSMPRILMVIDWGIILTGLFVFGTERTMYALITIFICTIAMEYFAKWPNFTKAVFIITDNAENVGKQVMEKMNHGVTSLEGHGVYTGNKKNILLCVIYDKEIPRMKEVVSAIDANAFMIVTDAREVLGQGFERMEK